MSLYDPDYTQKIQTMYWNLMSVALKKKLCIRLEKHINSTDYEILLVRIFPIDKDPVCLFSEFDLAIEISLFNKVEKFIRNY